MLDNNDSLLKIVRKGTMMVVLFMVLLFSCTVIVAENEVLPDNYHMLPKVFYFNDTEECPRDHFYCKLTIGLRPKDDNDPPEIWKTMKQYMQRKGFYNRTRIYRGICVENNVIQEEYNEYLDQGLSGIVERSFCRKKIEFFKSLTLHDVIFILAVASYLSFVIYCTYYHTKPSNTEDGNKEYEYLQAFSLKNTWDDIGKTPDSADFNRAFQGVRTIGMMGVVAAHNFTLGSILYSYNPEYFELSYLRPMGRLIYGFMPYIPTAFFVLSAWLLAIQLNNIIERNGKFTLKNLGTIIIHRYFRLMPPILLASWGVSSSLLFSLTNPYNYALVDEYVNTCKNYWWKNLFFIQNWIGIISDDMCIPVTWYPAVDMQMVVVVTVAFYISHKFKISLIYLFGAISGVAALIQGSTILTTEYDALLQFDASHLPPEGVFARPEFRIAYTRTVTNMLNYFVGFGFGMIFIRNRNRHIFDTPMKKLIWLVCFLGPILFVSYFHTRKPRRELEALMAITFRSIISFGYGMGFLGISTHKGGILKRILEWKWLVVLAPFTYAVFLYHVLTGIGRVFHWPKMVQYDDWFLYSTIVFDIVHSFLLGFIMYCILEHPLSKIQKLLLPRIKLEKKQN